MSTYKYLDDNGLIYYHSKVKALLNNKVDKVSGKGLSTNDYTTAEKNKLSGIAAGAQVNQNAFSNVKVGSTTIGADNKTDTLEFVASTGIVLTPDATNDTITIACNAEVPTKTSDLTNDSGFITSSDYATENTGGTVKAKSTYGLSNDAGTLRAINSSYPNYVTADKQYVISKGTLENVITGKGLISNTDYATYGNSGIIKNAGNYAFNVSSESGREGQPFASAQTGENVYGSSASAYNNYFAAIGTVKNMINYLLDTSISASSLDTHYPSSKCVYDAIQDAIGSITGLSFEIVQTLPTTGVAGTIYLVPNSGTAPNIYDEYVWLASTNKFEKIGTTDVDLSGYVQASEMVTITNAEIDTIVA